MANFDRELERREEGFFIEGKGEEISLQSHIQELFSFSQLHLALSLSFGP